MCEMMSMESKEALTVLIVTHVTHVERVKSGACGFIPLASPQYAVRAHNIFIHNFLNIHLIFNSQKVLES